MQARVIGMLESVASAMPGVGYVLGGLIATGCSPRATFLVAGVGVIAIVAVSASLLGRNWPPNAAQKNVQGTLTPRDEIMVELIPGSRPCPVRPRRS